MARFLKLLLPTLVSGKVKLLETGSTLVNSPVPDKGASQESQKSVGSAGLTGIKGIQQLGGFGQKNEKGNEKVAFIT